MLSLCGLWHPLLHVIANLQALTESCNEAIVHNIAHVIYNIYNVMFVSVAILCVWVWKCSHVYDCVCVCVCVHAHLTVLACEILTLTTRLNVDA